MAIDLPASDCSGFIEPLNLQCLLGTTLSGTAIIFTTLAVIFLAGLAGYFKMNNLVFLSLLGLFGILFASIVGTPVYLLIIVFAGLASFWSIAKIIKT